jgi:hypothetical protein
MSDAYVRRDTGHRMCRVCRRDGFARWAQRVGAERPPVECLRCGRAFRTASKRARYCGRECYREVLATYASKRWAQAQAVGA